MRKMGLDGFNGTGGCGGKYDAGLYSY